MTTEFSARLPRMAGEEIGYQHYTRGLLAFIRENTFTLEGNGRLPDWLKAILSGTPKVGDQFFHLTPDGPILYEITQDGCREVE